MTEPWRGCTHVSVVSLPVAAVAELAPARALQALPVAVPGQAAVQAEARGAAALQVTPSPTQAARRDLLRRHKYNCVRRERFKRVRTIQKSIGELKNKPPQMNVCCFPDLQGLQAQQKQRPPRTRQILRELPSHLHPRGDAADGERSASLAMTGAVASGGVTFGAGQFLDRCPARPQLRQVTALSAL